MYIILIAIIALLLLIVIFQAVRNKKRSDGFIIITSNENGSPVWSFDFKDELEAIERRKVVTFEIIKEPNLK